MEQRYTRFLDRLSGQERNQVEGAVRRTLQDWPYGSDVRALGNGLWEIRVRLPTRVARAFLGKTPNGVIPIDGLVKKDEGRHSRAIRRARKRLRELTG